MLQDGGPWTELWSRDTPIEEDYFARHSMVLADSKTFQVKKLFSALNIVETQIFYKYFKFFFYFRRSRLTKIKQSCCYYALHLYYSIKTTCII